MRANANAFACAVRACTNIYSCLSQGVVMPPIAGSAIPSQLIPLSSLNMTTLRCIAKLSPFLWRMSVTSGILRAARRGTADRIAWKQRLLDNRLLQTFTTEGVYHYSVAIGWRRKRCKVKKSLIGGTKDSSEIQDGRNSPVRDY